MQNARTSMLSRAGVPSPSTAESSKAVWKIPTWSSESETLKTSEVMKRVKLAHFMHPGTMVGTSRTSPRENISTAPAWCNARLEVKDEEHADDADGGLEHERRRQLLAKEAGCEEPTDHGAQVHRGRRLSYRQDAQRIPEAPETTGGQAQAHSPKSPLPFVSAQEDVVTAQPQGDAEDPTHGALQQEPHLLELQQGHAPEDLCSCVCHDGELHATHDAKHAQHFVPHPLESGGRASSCDEIACWCPVSGQDGLSQVA
mmetsp:Transcript_67196/g.210173  ORF Transcript_67196/g.210173 Transcript_67196/m.210173 type:complete len:257 (+) Transcript_67196:296-1066(+)